jgi:hypothetical protein
MAVASVQFLLLARNNQHGHDTLGMAVGASDICAPSSPSKKGQSFKKRGILEIHLVCPQGIRFQPKKKPYGSIFTWFAINGNTKNVVVKAVLPPIIALDKMRGYISKNTRGIR